MGDNHESQKSREISLGYAGTQAIHATAGEGSMKTKKKNQAKTKLHFFCDNPVCFATFVRKYKLNDKALKKDVRP